MPKAYANCIDGDEPPMNDRIESALAPGCKDRIHGAVKDESYCLKRLAVWWAVCSERGLGSGEQLFATEEDALRPPGLVTAPRLDEPRPDLNRLTWNT